MTYIILENSQKQINLKNNQYSFLMQQNLDFLVFLASTTLAYTLTNKRKNANQKITLE